VPEVNAQLSRPAVLVMQRLTGTPVSEAGEVLAAMPPELRAAAADRLLGAVLRQVLVGGVFHADLHPGNVLVDETGRLGLLDFGSVGRLDDGSREALAMLLAAIDRDSSVAAADALLELCGVFDHAHGSADRVSDRCGLFDHSLSWRFGLHRP
jgi:ubiquinone biosynthesis protein